MIRSETKRLVIFRLGDHHAHVSKKANEYGEFVTRYFIGPRVMENADDFQSTFEDAENTAIANLNHLNKGA